MTHAAIILLIISAFLHASWNVASKKRKPSAAFFLAANTTGCLLLLPVAAVQFSRYALFPPRVWLLLVLTGSFQMLYYASLAGAYRSGNMSIAYPLARSSPAIVVAAVTLLLGQGDKIGRLCLVGILLVVAGCFMVPMKSFRDFRLKNYLCRTCLLALLAAIGTAGYSITDAEALGLLMGNLRKTESIVVLTIMYAFMEALSASIFLSLYVAFISREREQLKAVLKSGRRVTLLTGACIYVTYVLVLISMSWVSNVSYVVGFRQLSIPLGVAMGAIFLKEKVSSVKMIGVAFLVTGLIFIALD